MADRMRGAGRRAFRPGADLGERSALESRLLLSGTKVVRVAPKPFIQSFTQFGGQIAKIVDTKGNVFNVDMVGGGHVRARPMKGGRVMLIVDGSTSASQLSINYIHPPIVEGTAHTYQGTSATGDPRLKVGAIKVKSGTIGEILGYQTADLSGPITATGTGTVNRIAFYSLQPGASITTGGDVNILDTYNDLTISGGPGISIGRDLNWLFVRGNLTVGTGSTFSVGRDVGLTFAFPNGTDPGGQGAQINGNLTIEPNAALSIGRFVDNTFLVNGQGTGASRISFLSGAQFFFFRGGFTA